MARSVPERISWAVDQLSIGPDDRVLEIGCGRGVAVEVICGRLNGGRITAIDQSAKAVAAAAERNAAQVAAGRAVFHRMALEDLDLPGESSDKVFAINVNLFWVDDPAPKLELLRRVLAPGGAIYLCYQPPSPAQTARLTDRVIAALTAAGFEPDIVTGRTSRGADLLCAIAQRLEEGQ